MRLLLLVLLVWARNLTLGVGLSCLLLLPSLVVLLLHVRLISISVCVVFIPTGVWLVSFIHLSLFFIFIRTISTVLLIDSCLLLILLLLTSLLLLLPTTIATTAVCALIAILEFIVYSLITKSSHLQTREEVVVAVHWENLHVQVLHAVVVT